MSTVAPAPLQDNMQYALGLTTTTISNATGATTTATLLNTATTTGSDTSTDASTTTRFLVLPLVLNPCACGWRCAQEEERVAEIEAQLAEKEWASRNQQHVLRKRVSSPSPPSGLSLRLTA